MLSKNRIKDGDKYGEEIIQTKDKIPYASVYFGKKKQFRQIVATAINCTQVKAMKDLSRCMQLLITNVS